MDTFPIEHVYAGNITELSFTNCDEVVVVDIISLVSFVFVKLVVYPLPNKLVVGLLHPYFNPTIIKFRFPPLDVNIKLNELLNELLLLLLLM
jgi:hypothetical protein